MCDRFKESADIKDLRIVFPGKSKDVSSIVGGFSKCLNYVGKVNFKLARLVSKFEAQCLTALCSLSIWISLPSMINETTFLLPSESREILGEDKEMSLECSHII